MLFNSLDFAIFLPIIFFIYWFAVQKNLKQQNILILLARAMFSMVGGTGGSYF
jgi:hypothetical protein